MAFIPTDVVSYVVEVFSQYGGWWTPVGLFISESHAIKRCREIQRDGVISRVIESRSVRREVKFEP